jgi:hypothetical protein
VEKIRSFLRFVRYEVGDGFKVRFVLLAIKEALLADLVQVSNDNH